MLRRILGVVLVNLIVFCVLAELLALFLFYNETGRLFYTYQKPYEPIAETQQGRLATACILTSAPRTGRDIRSTFPSHYGRAPRRRRECRRTTSASPRRTTIRS